MHFSVTMNELTVAREHFDDFFHALASRGYTIVGPTVRDGAIVYAEIQSTADLPEGFTDVQDAGRYALKRRTAVSSSDVGVPPPSRTQMTGLTSASLAEAFSEGGGPHATNWKDRALFGYAVGPHSWKKYLYPPRLTLWRAERKEKGFEVVTDGAPTPRYAFFAARACEISAMAIHDRVLMGGALSPESLGGAFSPFATGVGVGPRRIQEMEPQQHAQREFIDPHYAARRQGAFVVAIQCGQAGGTCFCVSMGTGPRANSGFDLALTEILKGDRHEFLVEVGTERGAELLHDVRHARATEEQRRLAAEVVDATRAQMGRSLETDGIRDLLAKNLEHPRWEQVAERCLACGNCTMVCPTCFCVSVEDTTDLRGEVASRERVWDSCFTTAFSYVHGGSVRASHAARYRQWLTHKLGTWHDQFGSSGCVGCGRCITWCPTGIDLTEEVRAIRGSET